MVHDFSMMKFPFRKLNIKVERRDLLFSLLKEVTGTTGQINQKPTYKIEDLGLLSLSNLEKITPALFAGCEFKSDDGFVFGKAPRHLNFIKLFSIDSPAHTIFQFFNLDRTIHQLSISVRKRYPLEAQESLLFVRGLFLFLAEEGFAYPKFGKP